MQRDVLLTPEGLDKLKDEIEHLSTVKRREVAEQGELVRGVEPGGGLVGQQHARLLGQCPGHQHARPLAARHLEHRPALQVRDVHGSQRRIDRLRIGSRTIASLTLRPASI